MQHIRSFLKHTRLTIVLALLALGASTALATSVIYNVGFDLNDPGGPLFIGIEAECSTDAIVVITDLATGTQTTYQYGGPLNGSWKFTVPMQPGQAYRVDIYCVDNSQPGTALTPPNRSYEVYFVSPGDLIVIPV